MQEENRNAAKQTKRLATETCVTRFINRGESDNRDGRARVSDLFSGRRFNSFFVDFQEHLRGGTGIAEGAMVGLEGNPEGGAERPEPVRRQAGKMAAHRYDGAEGGGFEVFSEALELGPDKAVVELHPMGDKNGVTDKLTERISDFPEAGCLRDHRVGDAGEADDELGNTSLRIHE